MRFLVLNRIVILGGARDFHAMDWYRTVQKNMADREVVFLTDLVESEGYCNIVTKTDRIEKLFVIDKFLFKKQSSAGSAWRNFFKILVLPIQIYKLRKFYNKNPNSIFHAHPMYYMLLCWLSRIEYIGSPQGSEILVRPNKSVVYNFFAIRVLRSAKYVIVDSVNMKNKIQEMSGVNALVHQYGIDVQELKKYKNRNKQQITSIRGMTPLYRINEIFNSREYCGVSDGINFIYPHYEEGYLTDIKNRMIAKDKDCGRLKKNNMYRLLSETYLAISIPMSDSSPRSVYEAIFLGCIVAVTYNPFIACMPKCMRDRIIIVDLNDKEWLKSAIKKAKQLIQHDYIPSSEAISIFDQDLSIKRVIDELYI